MSAHLVAGEGAGKGGGRGCPLDDWGGLVGQRDVRKLAASGLSLRHLECRRRHLFPLSRSPLCHKCGTDHQHYHQRHLEHIGLTSGFNLRLEY